MAKSNCPNPNSESWKILTNEVGKDKAEEIRDMNGGVLPTPEEIPKWIAPFKTKERQLKELDKKSAVEDILNNLDDSNVEKLPNQEGYINTETGEKYSKRVTALTSEYARQHNIQYTGDPDPFYGKKGAVLHRYMEEIGKAIVEGRSPSIGEVQNEVFKLLELDQFADETESFMRMKPNQFKKLRDSMRDFINSIKAIQNKEIDPEGDVEFRFEIPIASERRDLAGTVDMVAIFSDGTAGVYDFKSFSRPGRQPPGQKVINKWNVQLINYKNILKQNYGVSKFRQSRIIPIQTNYSKKDLKTGEYINQVSDGFQGLAMQNNQNADALEHLDPIPVEELTGDENLDRLVKKLIKERQHTEELYNRATADKKPRLLNKLTRLNNALQNIQLNRDIVGMIKDVINLYNRYDDRLNLSETDNNYMTDQELVDALGELDIYDNLIQDYQDQLKSLDKDKRKKVGKMLGSALKASESLKGRILEEATNRVGKEVTQQGEHVGFFARQFSGIEDWNIPAFQRLSKLVRLANESKRRETKREFKHVDEIDEAFSEWADQQGYGDIEKFELIYNEETGNLVRKYQPEYWERRWDITEKARNNEKLTSDEKKWMQEHFEFDQERFNRRKELIFQNIDHAVENQEISEKKGKERKELFLNRNSIKRNTSNFFTTNYLLPKEETSQEYLSDDWQFIQQHEPLKDYYEMYLEYNQRWSKEFGPDTIGRYFIPNVKTRLIEQVLQQGVTGATNLFDALQRQHQIYQQDELHGATDSKGRTFSEVPLLYTDPVSVPITDTEEQQIRAEVEADAEILYERGTEGFKNEVKKRIKQKEFEKGRKLKSKDLTQSLKAMIYSASNYRHKSAIEGEVGLIQALIENKRVEQKEITEQDRARIREFMGDTVKKMGLDSSLEQAFNDFVDMLVYDKKLKGDQMWFNDYSRNKIIRSFMNFLSVRALGLNFTIQAADYVQGRSSLWMMAKEDRYFGTDGYKSIIQEFGSREEDFRNLIEFFEPQARDMRAEDIELSGAGVVSKYATQRSLFIGYAWSDDNISSVILGAMSKRYIVDSDGKIKNPKIHGDRIIDEDAPTVYEALEKNEEGKLVIPGLSKEEFTKFRAQVHKMSNRIRGTMNEHQRGLINQTILGQALMQFRSWIPGLATTRFQKLKYDQTMESFEIGRFNVAMGEVIGNGMMPNLKEVMKLSTEVVSMGLYKKNINRERVKEQLDKFLSENQQYEEGDLSVEEFIQLKRDKLNGFVAEMRVYMAFFVLTQLLASLDWDEFDEEEAAASIFTYEANQLARRALLEASFWYSPSSVDEIIKSPIALWGVANEMYSMLDNSIVEASYAIKGERNPRDETPFGYYMLRNTPVANQVLEIFNFFNRYNPPKSIFEKVTSDPDGG